MRPTGAGLRTAVACSLLKGLRFDVENNHPSGHGDAHESEDGATRLYRRVMGPLLHHTGWRAGFLSVVALLLLAACGLVALGLVKVKMLPFDNIFLGEHRKSDRI